LQPLIKAGGKSSFKAEYHIGSIEGAVPGDYKVSSTYPP